MITLTGPIMTAGPELAEAASSALSTKLQFQSITECVAYFFRSAVFNRHRSLIFTPQQGSDGPSLVGSRRGNRRWCDFLIL